MPPTPPERDEIDQDLNRRIGSEALLDGRVFFGSTIDDGKVAFRPAMVNWRNRREDVESIASVVRGLAREIAPVV